VKPGQGSRFDEALVASSAAGDRAAREKLASACLPRVWRMVYLSCRGGPEVEDLVQTAMAQAFVDLPRFRGTGSFAAWLDRVTINVVRQHYRRRYLRALLPSSDTLELFPEEREPAADARAESRRLGLRLAHHLGFIKPKHREAIVLSLVQGCSVSEIAMIVGCNIETAKKRLLRGRQELAARLRRDPFCREMIEEMGR
jgi:RNA polymerase sigma-70 factor, ECF subfamily